MDNMKEDLEQEVEVEMVDVEDQDQAVEVDQMDHKDQLHLLEDPIHLLQVEVNVLGDPKDLEMMDLEQILAMVHQGAVASEETLSVDIQEEMLGILMLSLLSMKLTISRILSIIFNY